METCLVRAILPEAAPLISEDLAECEQEGGVWLVVRLQDVAVVPNPVHLQHFVA